MTFPGPRTTADGPSDREYFLAACAQMWDNSRPASRAQLVHGATMITAKLGGTVLMRAECSYNHRTVPEAGYVSEEFAPYRGLI
jgi:hypothetical protein